MRTLVMVMFAVIALASVGCGEEKKPEGNKPAPTAAQTGAAKAPGTAAPAKTAAPGGGW